MRQEFSGARGRVRSSLEHADASGVLWRTRTCQEFSGARGRVRSSLEHADASGVLWSTRTRQEFSGARDSELRKIHYALYHGQRNMRTGISLEMCVEGIVRGLDNG
jgi:hypothetical protein